jgi:hypothetical protein
MGLSYKNILNDQLSSSLGDKNSTSARYIKGYAQDSGIEALANSLNINKGLFKQTLGIEDKKLDNYDPYHTSDAKNEEGWYSDDGSQMKASTIQEYDDDTNTFKKGLYSQAGFRGNDFWYEDPFIPAFELFFDQNSPFFSTADSNNSLMWFINHYGNNIDSYGYENRGNLWTEFRNVFFKIFETDLLNNRNRNFSNKAYYITKIAGLENLNNKFINYNGKDGETNKITITLNEDVSMIAWYLSELYNNIIYSYKNQRHMFPENLIRFNMTIKINDFRNFTMPNKNDSKVDPQHEIKNTISPKSQIVYTLHDCNFNFEKSKNYENEMEIGGYGSTISNKPQTLSFDIYYKSVTRWSTFPLLYSGDVKNINPWELEFKSSSKQEYYDNLDRLSSTNPIAQKGFTNQLLSKAGQTIANNSLNYMDSLETKLRNVRGSTVNNLLNQFTTLTGLNKIEPDNVYTPDFNDRTSLKNFGKSIGSGLLADLENTTRNAANF